MTSIKLVIIDDHLVVIKGICQFLEETCSDIVVVGKAFTADEGLALIGKANPDVVIIDINLPCADPCVVPPEMCSYGLGLIRIIGRRLPSIGILALTGLPTSTHREAVIRAGACGYLIKDCTGSEMAEAIRMAGRGENLQPRSSPAMQDLTDREVEIFHLISQGAPERNVASWLHISLNTVATHRKRIYSKLGISNHIEAARIGSDEMDRENITP